MMTLSQLRTFQTVARLNSFSRAADELHLTQPAVSSQIVALENALKVKLFDRLGKTIALTQSGCVVLACAEEIHKRLFAMHRELDDLGDLRSGTLNIGASLLVGVHVLPEMLASFKKKWPLINLVVRVLPAHEPGTFFAYNSPATHALSAIVTAVTGEPLTAYLRPRLLDPLGIGERWMSPLGGIEHGASGYHLTVDDLARTAHYGEVADTVVRLVTGEPVDLIETLAVRIAAAVLA